MRPSVLCLVALASCAQPTQLHLDIDASGASALDSYQLQVGDRIAVAAPSAALDVWVPDAMAGAPAHVQLWGIHDGTQVAYGAADVTPVAHDSVDVHLTLGPVMCGTWCMPGTVACTTAAGHDGVMTCEQKADGCYGWSAVTACPSAMPFCSSGACGATCADECRPGETICDGTTGTRRCGEYDSDSCLDWSPATACPSGETCSQGTCEAATTCSDGDTCDDGNSCTAGDTCEAGVCAGDPITCTTPPPATCTDDHTLRISSGGACGNGTCHYTSTDVRCENGCSAGRCITELGGGEGYACAVTGGANLRCWGKNDYHQADPPPGYFHGLAVGTFHACALTPANAVKCWGGDYLGDTHPPSGTFSQVAAGLDFTCGVRTNGSLACWGNNEDGKATPPAGSTFTHVAVGGTHACALRADHTYVCWGDDSHQQLEPGPVTPTVASELAVSLADSSCSLDLVHHWLYCWGVISGQPLGTVSFENLTANATHVCAITSGTHAVQCAGIDDDGELDAPSGTFTTVAAGWGFTCARRTSGAVVCWGLGDDGQTNVPAGL